MNFLKISFTRLLAVLALALTFAACEKDDDEGPDNESELITTVTLTFVNTSTNVATVATFTDPDGPGGVAPVVQPITLQANATYVLTVAFLDASNPADVENITEEVIAEAEEHLVCFTTTGAIPAPVATDKDANGKPLGVVNSLSTGGAATGTLTVILKHQPDKNAASPCATGETDVETTPAFPVTVQ